MKLTIDPKLLAELVAWAARAVPARPNIPALSGLLLEAGDNDTLTASAFDYDVSVRGHITADVAEPGRILLPGRVLAEIGRALPTSSYAQLAANNSEAVLTCGTAEYTLPLLPVDDYPTLPQPPAPVGSINGEHLAAAINQTYPACSNDDTLPMLTAIRINTNGDQLTLAATDRYRIAVTDTTWTPTSGGPIGVCLPGRHLHDIGRALGGGDVTLAVNDTLAAFTTDSRATTVRLLDDQFIPYRERVDGNQPIVATVDAAALAAAVKRVAIVAERNTAIRLAFTNNQVQVRAGSADIGRGGDTVDCALAGEPIDIAFQSAFLLDGLAVDGTVTIGMEAPHKPALISSEDGSYKYLAMSLRLT